MTVVGETSLVFIALIQVALGITLVVVLLNLAPRLRELSDQTQAALNSLRHTLINVNGLIAELRQSELIEQAKLAMQSAHGAVDRIDPLATELQATLTNARTLLDDATETSQTVRARVEDFAATQKELTSLASAMTDVVSEVRDRELAAKLSNVLSDTSLLAADLGILTENANSYLESGRPLVSNIGGVVSSARQRASGISSTLGGLREGFRAGVKTFKEEGRTRK